MNIDFINTLLDASRDVVMGYFRNPHLSIDTKADQTPVSIADRESEIIIRKLIEQFYPDHGIIGEEFGITNRDVDHIWIIDPIDGTKAFIAGIDTFANMVCLLHKGIPILSGIGFPARNERYIAIDGITYLNGETITVQHHELINCSLCYTDPSMFKSTQIQQVTAIKAITQDENIGGDAYNYCRLAGGDARVVMEADLQPYDFLPLVPIIENAGGTITDWNGHPLTLTSTGEAIATPHDHTIAINALQTAIA